MWNPLTTKGFLMVGGIVLIIVGLLSFVLPGGVLIPGLWQFDTTEGYVHILLGVVAIAAVYVLPASLHKPLVIVVGIVGLIFATSFLWTGPGYPTGMNIAGASLEHPMDDILHLFVGVWALYASLVSKAT